MDSYPDDRISELPDLILTKILSFLPTKNAFAATVLSTRWKNLFPVWFPPVKLDLDDSDLLHPDGNSDLEGCYFDDFVDKLFNETLRDVPCINTMSLKCQNKYGDVKTMSWVCAAGRLNVHELQLEFNLYSTVPLFQSFYQCTKLKTLNLCNIGFGSDKLGDIYDHYYYDDGTSMMTMLNKACPELEELSLVDCPESDNILFKFPQLKTLKIKNSLGPSCEVRIETPKLKILELCNVIFDIEVYHDAGHDENGELMAIDRLISLVTAFPVLEGLSLTNCDWQGVPDLIIKSDLLRSLIIRNSLGSSDRVSFNIPNLQLLLTEDLITKYNFIHPFNSLHSTHIDVGPSEKQLAAIKKHRGDKDPWHFKHARGLVRYCSETRHLHLYSRAVEVLQHTPVDLPTFHNLVSLKLVCLCRSGWKVLARLLCSSPYLEKLVFEKGFEECNNGYSEFESVVSTPPVCLKFNLKEIDFLEFNEVKDAFKLIEYFLKNGEAMRRLKLQCRPIENKNSLNTLLKLSKKSKIVITFASWKDEMLLEEISSHLV